jgi:hypothetical protein
MLENPAEPESAHMEPARLHLQDMVPAGCSVFKVHSRNFLVAEDVAQKISIRGGADLIIVADAAMTEHVQNLDRCQQITNQQARSMLEAIIGLVEYKKPDVVNGELTVISIRA